MHTGTHNQDTTTTPATTTQQQTPQPEHTNDYTQERSFDEGYDDVDSIDLTNAPLQTPQNETDAFEDLEPWVDLTGYDDAPTRQKLIWRN